MIKESEFSLMGALSRRLAQAASLNKPTVSPVMYSPAGAQFQESMLSAYADVFAAHKSTLSPELGKLITAINNDQMSVDQAVIAFHKILYSIVGY